MRKIIIVLIAVAALAACTSIDCPVKNTVYTVYGLKKADGTTDTLNTDTLWVWSQRVDGTDTVITTHREDNIELNCYYGPKATTFQLPISYTQPEDVFFLVLGDITKTRYVDTIRIKKENYPHFESVDCSAAYFHKITAVSTTHNVIDSIVIHHADVNYDNEQEHFYIYFNKTDR